MSTPAIFTELRKRYGRQYNHGVQTFPDGGFHGHNHWGRNNDGRWERSAEGILSALYSYGIVLSPTKGWVLEVGCGTGQMVWEMRRCGVRAAGIDIGDELNYRFCSQANILGIPFLPGTFDAIVGLDVVEHVPDEYQESLFAELRGALRDSHRSKLILTVPTVPPYFIRSSEDGVFHHYLCMPVSDWEAGFEQFGFQVVAKGRDLENFGLPFTHGPDNFPFILEVRR